MKYIFATILSIFLIVNPVFSHKFSFNNIFVGHPHIKINNGFVKGYLTIYNKSKTNIYLTGIKTNFADGFELHKDELINNNLEMKVLKNIAIPANKEVSFKNSNLHIMFSEYDRTLEWFETHKAILIFNNNIELAIEFDVDYENLN